MKCVGLGAFGFAGIVCRVEVLYSLCRDEAEKTAEMAGAVELDLVMCAPSA